MKTINKYMKIFNIKKGDSANDGMLNVFLDSMKTKRRFLGAPVYTKNYKVIITIKELRK